MCWQTVCGWLKEKSCVFSGKSVRVLVLTFTPFLKIQTYLYIRIRNNCSWYGIFLLVFNLIFHSFTALTREMSGWTLEEKIHIYAQPCIIVYHSYVICDYYLFHTVFHLKSCEQPPLNPFTRQCKFVLTFKLLLTSYPLNHKRCKLSHGVTPIRSISSPSPLSLSLYWRWELHLKCTT